MNKITMETESFLAIVNRVKSYGRVDEFGTYHLGHWEYRIEDGGMTQVIVNTSVGMAYYRSCNKEVEGQFLVANI